MKTFAYCDRRYEQATRLAVGAGASLLVSPPASDGNFLALKTSIESAGLVYFNFHAVPGVPVWLNVEGGTALIDETLRSFNLSRAVVYMVNCYTGGGMFDAVKATHPRAIIGGAGENLGALNALAGADKLGKFVREALTIGAPPALALDLAKLRLRAGPLTPSVKDALEFKIL